MGTKRSEKGTPVTTLAGFDREYRFSGWNESIADDAFKDNPVLSTVFKDLSDAVASPIVKAFFKATNTSDLVIMDGGDLSINGSIHTIGTVGYAYYQGEIVKINSGSAVLGDTIIFELSATEDGQFRTLDIANGASGSGFADLSNTIWIKDHFRFDHATKSLRIGFDESNFCDFTVASDGVVSASKKLNITSLSIGGVDLITSSLAGTGVRLATVNAAGLIGNDTSIDGLYTFIEALKINSGLKIRESASAGSNEANYAQLWVKNESPNELRFTNRLGDETRLSGERYYSISPSKFVANGSDSITYSITQGFATLTPDDHAIASVELPDGCTIKQVKLGGEDINVTRLYKVDHATHTRTQLTSATSEFTSSTITEVVDNSAYTYFVDFNADDGAFDTPRIHYAWIKYII